MNDHVQILRRVGWVLVVIGTLDIGVMIYCIANKISYSSSFNVFALVAGIYLLRGHLGAVRYVTWFGAFFLSAMLLGCLTVFPWIQPTDYWLIQIRQHPISSVLSLLFAVTFLSMLLWVYRQLRLPAVVAARNNAGHKSGPPVLAFVAGFSLAILMGVMLQLTLRGPEAKEAVERATKQYGDEYKYFVSSINYGGNHVSARLVAYKESETKNVEVEWKR